MLYYYEISGKVVSNNLLLKIATVCADATPTLVSTCRLLYQISDKLDGLIHKKTDTAKNMEDFLAMSEEYESKAHIDDGKKHVSKHFICDA